MSREAWDNLKKEFPEPDNQDDELFKKIINAVLDNGIMSEKELAEEFGVSKPTIARWRAGITSPHPAVRKSLLRHMYRL